MSTSGTVKTEELKTEVVVIGGGGGGLTAAVAAAEKGVNVIILEKRRVLGGNAPRGGGPPRIGSAQERGFTAISRMQGGVDTADGRDDFFKKAMEWSHWRADARLVRTLIEKSGDTIRWLGEMGMKFESYKYPSSDPLPPGFGFGPGARGAAYVKELTKQCKKLGVQFFLNTRAKKLLTDKEGRVIGVLAEAKDKELKISAKSVIMSTGGFLGNKELMKKYFHSYTDDLYDDIHMGGLPHTGDGLLMATEIGAATDGTVAFEWNANRFPWLLMRLPVSCSALVEVLDPAVNAHPIWVNKKGERYCDETSGQCANSLYRQPHKTSYTIFDENIKQEMLSGPPRTESDIPLNIRLEKEIQEQMEKGRIKIADSWDEIAEFIGAKPEVLKATVDEYNSFCNKGHDDLFLKDPKNLVPLRTPPYYAVECRLNMLLTRGPLKVSPRMEVLDKNDDPIPGLYAAGVDIGGTDSDTYCGVLQAHSIGFTISSGRIAAENAAKSIKGG